LGVTSQGSPVESRYLTNLRAIILLPARLSCLSSRGPALVFDRILSSPNASESFISESDQSYICVRIIILRPQSPHSWWLVSAPCWVARCPQRAACGKAGRGGPHARVPHQMPRATATAPRPRIGCQLGGVSRRKSRAPAPRSRAPAKTTWVHAYAPDEADWDVGVGCVSHCLLAREHAA